MNIATTGPTQNLFNYHGEITLSDIKFQAETTNADNDRRKQEYDQIYPNKTPKEHFWMDSIWFLGRFWMDAGSILIGF